MTLDESSRNMCHSFSAIECLDLKIETEVVSRSVAYTKPLPATLCRCFKETFQYLKFSIIPEVDEKKLD